MINQGIHAIWNNAENGGPKGWWAKGTVGQREGWKLFFVTTTKGQLISKANCQAEDSPKKRTNEFVFATVRRVFVCFLGESLA